MNTRSITNVKTPSPFMGRAGVGLLLFFLFTLSSSAQVFTQGDKELENNAVITITEAEEDDFGGLVMNSNLFIKNKMVTTAYVKVEYEVESISNGMMQICFPVLCHTHPQAGVFTADDNGKPVGMAANTSKDLQTEWLPDAEGTCRVRYTIKRFSSSGVPQGSGNTVTVIYNYSPNAILSPESDIVSVSYFDLAGRSIAQPKGACIVRQILRNGQVLTRKLIHQGDK